LEAAETREQSNTGEEVITGITLKVMNGTPGESLTPATISSRNEGLLVSCRYKLPGDANNTYRLSEKVLLRASIPPNNDTSGDIFAYSFSFLRPIPANATEIQYTLVYRGGLGAEADAVAAKVFQISPPADLYVALDVVDANDAVVGVIATPADTLSQESTWQFIDVGQSLISGPDGIKIVPEARLYATPVDLCPDPSCQSPQPLFEGYDEVVPSNKAGEDITVSEDVPGSWFTWGVRTPPGVWPATVTRTFTIQWMGTPWFFKQWIYTLNEDFTGSIEGKWINTDYAMIPFEYPRAVGPVGKAITNDRYGILIVENEFSSSKFGYECQSCSRVSSQVIFRGSAYEVESASAVQRLYDETTYPSENKSKYYSLATGDRYLYFYTNVEYSGAAYEGHEATIHAHAVGLASERGNSIYRFTDIEPWVEDCGGPNLWPSWGIPEQQSPHGLARLLVPGRGNVFVRPNSQRLLSRKTAIPAY
jgi:hypothetical protein